MFITKESVVVFAVKAFTFWLILMKSTQPEETMIVL